VLLSGWQGQVQQRGPQGAPDLLIEVLSPSNRGHDLVTKRALYSRAGVREYWIVDPVSQTVELLTLDRDSSPMRQIASGGNQVSSPLLGTSFPVSAIFAGVGETED
jgi:Uma2 family endonuclease